MRAEEHYFFIGVVDSGFPEGPDYSKHKYSYCVLHTMVQFAKAIMEAIPVADKFDLNQGNVRKRIEQKTPSEHKFSMSPHAFALIGELSN